jgi:hypothetical protein
MRIGQKMFATPIMEFHTMKLIIESEPISYATGYVSCLNSVPDSR